MYTDKEPYRGFLIATSPNYRAYEIHNDYLILPTSNYSIRTDGNIIMTKNGIQELKITIDETADFQCDHNDILKFYGQWNHVEIKHKGEYWPDSIDPSAYFHPRPPPIFK